MRNENVPAWRLAEIVDSDHPWFRNSEYKKVVIEWLDEFETPFLTQAIVVEETNLADVDVLVSKAAENLSMLFYASSGD